MASDHPDRNLLFGILAVQMDFVSRDALIEGMNTWVLHKSESLGSILVDQGLLRPADRALLEPMVQRHIELHANDPRRSLAALSSVSSLQHGLQEIADPDVQRSLDLLSRDAELVRIEETTDVGRSDSSRRFRILHRHAEGGLGTVFVAYDEELHREVALKEIQQQHAMQAASRARFLQEAEITGNLEHPGVVPVYGLGHYEDGRPFYAMRFIKGDSLRDATRRFHEKAPSSGSEWRRIELRRLLGRFIDVCDAIGYAHSRGVLHRDLKPGNIMVGRYGETLVVDWGLAKLMGDTAEQQRDESALRLQRDGDPLKTMPGAAVGTPSYMSPEQAAGELDQLTGAADIYGLGATLYYVLTCRPPVSGNNTQETLEKVRLGAVTPLRAVNPDVARPLEAICMKALARQPARRYANCRDLANDLEAYLAGTPVSAYRGVVYRGGLWLRRHRTAAVVACLLVACLAGFAGYVAVRHRRVTRQVDHHISLARVAISANDLPKGMAELTAAEALITNDPTRARRVDRWQEQLKNYREFESRYNAMRLGTSPRSRVSSKDADGSETLVDDLVAKRATAALRLLSALNNPAWMDEFGDSLLSKQQLAGLREHVGETIVQLSLRIARQWNDDDESRRRTRTALAMLDDAKNYITFGTGLHSLQARWRRRLGETERVDSSWETALAIAKSGKTTKFSLFDQYVLAQVADAMLVREHCSAADGEKVSRLYEVVLKRDPQFFRAHFGLYTVRAKMGDVAGQLRHLEACLALSPNDPYLYYFRGMVYFARGSSDPERYRQAYDDFDTSVQRDPDFARGYYYRGRMRVVMGDWKAAAGDFDKAIEHGANLVGPYYWRAIARAKIGLDRQAAADAEEAVRRDPDDGLVLYYAARAFAQSVLAIQQSDMTDAAREHLVNTYADRSLELLTRAFAAGFDEVGRLVPGGDFTPLYGVADIRGLIERRCERLLENPPATAPASSGQHAPVLKGELLLVRGDLAKSAEQWKAASDWYERAQSAYFEAIKQQQRLPAGALHDMRRAMSGRVTMLDRLGQFDQADTAFLMLLRLYAKAEPELRIERAAALLDAGRHARAVDVVRMLKPDGLASELDCYDLACVHARAAGAVRHDPTVEPTKKKQLVAQYSARAVACLRAAHARRFFRTATGLEHLKHDPDLDPIRDLPVFQALVAEIKQVPADAAGPGPDAAVSRSK